MGRAFSAASRLGSPVGLSYNALIASYASRVSREDSGNKTRNTSAAQHTPPESSALNRVVRRKQIPPPDRHSIGGPELQQFIHGRIVRRNIVDITALVHFPAPGTGMSNGRSTRSGRAGGSTPDTVDTSSNSENKIVTLARLIINAFGQD